MAYRDDGEVARAQLAELEQRLAARDISGPLLRRYRQALHREVERLEHACLWYEDGLQFGLYNLDQRADLRPTRPPAALPAPAQATLTAPLDAAAATERVAALMRRLENDPLQGQIMRLQDKITGLRGRLSILIGRAPMAPPPPPALSLRTTYTV